MSVLSRIREFFNPFPALEPRALPVRSGARNFDAAAFSRLTKGWGDSLDAEMQRLSEAGRATLVRRSRDLWKNNDAMKRFDNLLRRSIVGPTGIRLQCQARDFSGKFDTAGNRAVQDAWTRWGRMGVCEISRRYSFWQLEQAWVTSLAMDGEAIAIIYPGWKKNGWGYALQLVESLALNDDLNVTLNNGNELIGGIEYDADGAPVNYYFKPKLAMRYGMRLYSTDGHRVVPADRVLHRYIWHFPGQGRGIPLGHAAMWSLYQLGEYKKAELIASKISAMKLGTLKRPALTKPPVTDPGEEDEPGDTNVDSNGSEVIDISAGQIYIGAAGEELQFFDPKHPHTDAGPFIKALLAGTAAALDIPEFELTADYSQTNFTSGRLGLSGAQDGWRMLQRLTYEGLHDVVYEQWLLAAMLRQQVTVAMPNGRLGTINADKFEKFQRRTWRPRGFPHIQPREESAADDLRITNGTTSRARVLNREGEDFLETMEQVAAEKEIMESLGLDFSPKAPPAQPGGAAGNPAESGDTGDTEDPEDEKNKP